MVDLQKYKDIPLKNKPPTKKQPIPLSVVPPQEALVPIWNSPFYATPDEPADPRDCDRYPDSPYCGGFAWTWTPVGIEPAIVLDDCNVGIELQPVLGWTKLPPVQVVYREQSEECRKKPSLSVPPLEENELFIPFPINPDRCCLYRVRIRHTIIGFVLSNGEFTNESFSAYAFNLPYVARTVENDHYCWSPIAGLKVVTKIGDDTRDLPSYLPELSGLPGREPGRAQTQDIYLLSRHMEENNAGTFLTVEQALYHFNIGDLIETRHARVKNRYKIESNAGYQIGTGGWTRYGASRLFQAPTITLIDEIWCPPNDFVLFLPPPPPPPPKRCDCNMTCCPDTTQNDQLLRSLIKKVDKLSSIVGVDDYPVSLPTSLISKDEGFFGNLIPNENVDVPSLTRFFAWYIERFDEIMGQWEIPIEVKDSDPSTPGEQPVGFKLPNMAESIAEMFGLMMQTSINSQILVNMNTRIMLEIGQNKQQGFKSYMLVLAIADHLGFDYKEIKHKIPMLFNINTDQLDQLLQESEIEVSAAEYTDSEDLKTVLLELRQAAAIIKAVHWRKFDINSNIAQGVKDLIMGLVATSDEVNDSGKDENDGKDKFDDFLEDAETGFTTSSGITDPDHPYGRNYKERPRIKEIGHESPGA